MYAEDCKIGQKFKHKYYEEVIVIEICGERYFENKDGDTFSYIDDDLLLYEI